jgi:hypothetical protein
MGPSMTTSVGLAVAGEVHELGAAAQGDVGLEGDGFERGEIRLHPLAAVRQPCPGSG